MKNRLRARLGDTWAEVWPDIVEHRNACLRKLEQCTVQLGREQMSEVRRLLELDQIVRHLEAHGP